MFIEQAALVRLCGNRVQGCGFLTDDEFVSALDLRDVVQLTLSDNRILDNGTVGAFVGGAGMLEICDNAFSFNRFAGLVVRLATPQQILLQALRLYLSMDAAEQEGTNPQLLVENNIFRKHFIGQFSLNYEGRVTVSGNTCTGGRTSNHVTADTPTFFVVTGNLFDPEANSTPLTVSSVEASHLILTSNMSTKNKPIEISGIGNVQKGFNQPPVP